MFTGRRFAVARSWTELCAILVHQVPPPQLVIIDVDPAIGGWRGDAAALHNGFLRIEQPLTDVLSPGCALAWVSNSARVANQFGPSPRHTPGGHPLLFGARKPLLRRLEQHLASRLWRPHADRRR